MVNYMISLDKIALKTKQSDRKSLVKKPWEPKEVLDLSIEKIKIESKKTAKKPRFEIPEEGRKNLSTVSESLELLGEVLKM